MAVLDNRYSREFNDHWRILTVAFTCLLFAFSAPAFMMPFLYPEVIREFGLPVAVPPEYDRARIQEYLLADKKTIGGKVFFVLPTTIGRVIITDDIEEGLTAKVL